MADVWANSMACHPRATCHIAGCCQLANSMSWFRSYVSHCKVLPLGKFNGMSSQSHVSHCRVLPLGEFTVTISEPHATLQSAVTWRNQCYDRATLQSVRIPSAFWKSFFAIFYFCFQCSLVFDEWRLSYRLQYTCLVNYLTDQCLWSAWRRATEDIVRASEWTDCKDYNS